MEITVDLQQANEPVAVMQLQGDIDASNFVQIVDKAQEIYQDSARNLNLDLSEVSSISSTGLAAIHKIALIYSGASGQIMHPDQTHSSSARKHVKLLNPQPEVEKALEAAGLKLFFKVFRDLDSALKSFQV
jgi:anti-anti-sigma factor